MQLNSSLSAPALIVIDLQKGIDDPVWGRRNNLQAEANIARLLDAWRATGQPIFHVKHNSTEPKSSYRPGQPGNEFKLEARPQSGETVIEKTTNSAFIGTDLEWRLRSSGIGTLIVTGVITNNSVEATVRMAGNLGFHVFLVSDGTATVDKRDLNGRLWSAEDVHALSLANMDGEYATVLSTDEILSAFGPVVV
jgi:nicotinamidase-related amidase